MQSILHSSRHFHAHYTRECILVMCIHIVTVYKNVSDIHTEIASLYKQTQTGDMHSSRLDHTDHIPH